MISGKSVGPSEPWIFLKCDCLPCPALREWSEAKCFTKCREQYTREFFAIDSDT